MPEVNPAPVAFLPNPSPDELPTPFVITEEQALDLPEENGNIKALLEPALQWMNKRNNRGQSRWWVMNAGASQQITNQPTKGEALEKLIDKFPFPDCYIKPLLLPRTKAEAQAFFDQGADLATQEIEQFASQQE